MSGVKVIKIAANREYLLGFLFPDYSVTDSNHGVSKFITHKDVLSRQERESLDLYYEDCVFISTRIFDEVWSDDILKEKCIEFAHNIVKNRKSKFEADGESFVEDCINYIFDLSDSNEAEINELLDAFGSIRFIPIFFEKCEHIPVQKLVASLSTFILKIMNVTEGSSRYYKEKAILYKKRIKENMLRASDAFSLREDDGIGVSWCKFFVDLYSKT